MKTNIQNFIALNIAILLLLGTSIYAETYKFPKNSEPHAKISLGFGSTKDEVDPAVVYAIDGIDIGVRDHYIALSPGKHTLLCRARFDVNDYDYKIPKGQRFENTVENNTLDITVEAGKTYFIGYSLKDIDIKKWKPVVFKVSEK